MRSINVDVDHSTLRLRQGEGDHVFVPTHDAWVTVAAFPRAVRVGADKALTARGFNVSEAGFRGTLPAMASRLRPVVRHPIVTIGWVATAGWAWRNRHRLASFRSLAMSAPGRVRRGGHRDLATELRLRGFLVRDATGRQIRDARLLEVVEGEAVIDGDPTSPDYAALVRLVAGRPGVTGLRQHAAHHVQPAAVQSEDATP